MPRFPEGTTAEKLRIHAEWWRHLEETRREGKKMHGLAAAALELAADLMDPAKAGFTECPKCGCPVKVLGDE